MYRAKSILNMLGVRKNLKGYHYICEAIELIREDESSLLNLKEQIYEVIALNHEQKWEAVQRNMATIVSRCWEEGREEELSMMMSGARVVRKPSVAEFLDIIYEYIKKKEMEV